MSNPFQHGVPPPPIVGGGGDPKPLLWQFIRRGDLVFDIGAHQGDRVREFLLMGCRVIAVEPQAGPRMHIPAEATVLPFAVSSASGTVTLWECPANSYMSTIMGGDYMRHVQHHGGANGYHYEQPIEVTAVTLDQLIALHGEPAFVKIDVEGAELEVLRGLSRPLQALSFEVHDFDPGKMHACAERLLALDDRYVFAYSHGESFELEPEGLPEKLYLFGDVYAWLPR